MCLTVRHISTSEQGKQIRSAYGKPGSGCAGIVSRQGGERPTDRANNTTAVCSQWHGCRPRSASGHNDTYVDGTSQSQTSRHKHGGRHEKHILRSGPPRRRLFFAFDNIVIPLIRTKQECGFCRLLCLTVRHNFQKERH